MTPDDAITTPPPPLAGQACSVPHHPELTRDCTPESSSPPAPTPPPVDPEED